jgi:anti-sigma B factor antagonist
MIETTQRQKSAWIEVHQESGTLILRVCGVLDMASSDAVESAIMAAIPTGYKVAVDLGDLTFCDSTGISLFIAANDKAQAEGTVLTFGNLTPTVAHLFHRNGLDSLFAITE